MREDIELLKEENKKLQLEIDELKPISLETGLYQANPYLYPQLQPIQFIPPQII